MTASDKKKKWLEFVDAFRALGSDALGMTPAAASLLAVTVAEHIRDSSKGYQSLNAGALIYAVSPEVGGPVVRIPDDYPVGFWDVDMKYLRGKVTQAACDYVTNRLEVFQLLEGL